MPKRLFSCSHDDLRAFDKCCIRHTMNVPPVSPSPVQPVAASAAASPSDFRIPPEMSAALQNSELRFRQLHAQLERLDARQLQQQAHSILTLPPAAVAEQLNTIQGWILDLGANEGPQQHTKTHVPRFELR